MKGRKKKCKVPSIPFALPMSVEEWRSNMHSEHTTSSNHNAQKDVNSMTLSKDTWRNINKIRDGPKIDVNLPNLDEGNLFMRVNQFKFTQDHIVAIPSDPAWAMAVVHLHRISIAEVTRRLGMKRKLKSLDDAYPFKFRLLVTEKNMKICPLNYTSHDLVTDDSKYEGELEEAINKIRETIASMSEYEFETYNIEITLLVVEELYPHADTIIL